MPKLTKQALANFTRTGCERQLRLLIATEAERAAEAMPGEQPPRPGLQEARREGDVWQHEKVTDLVNTFGPQSVVADVQTTRTGVTYRPIELADALAQARSLIPGQVPSVWLVEAQLAIGPSFESALGIAGQRVSSNIEYARLRPDLIEVRPPAADSALEVRPDGGTAPLGTGDPRLRLRVIDIKLTAEPSPGYFAEVTFYSMALAAWLEDQGLDREFVVTADAALWPGSHDASTLATTVDEIVSSGATPTPQELRDALADDLEPVPLEVFVTEVRRFFIETVPRVLASPWTDLEYHVDNRCKNCPFLGAPWIDANGQPTAEPGHCMKTAERDGHLSRVAYVTRGARTALEQGGVADVASLAGRTSADPVLDKHHVLRGTRTVVRERAHVLHAQQPATLAPQSGTSAVMPRWSDLRIHLSVDFDASSAITFAFALNGFWIEPLPYGTPAPQGGRNTQAWPTQVFVVDQRSVAAERREVLRFLSHLEQMLADARGRNPDSTYQIYIWDQLQLKHLARVIGRHLPAILADPGVRDLAWLFPSDELLPSPAALSRRSPITILRDVVRSQVAAPVTHYYSLLELARQYFPPTLDPRWQGFSVHPLFEDPLSDQIPSERAHEVWSRSGNPRRPWLQQLQTLEQVVKTRMSAAEQVRRRLEEDLRGELRQTAPRIRPTAPTPESGMALISQLWLTHARIDAALTELEVDQVRAMPPHERESKFRSARLTEQLTGAGRRTAVAALNHPGVRATDLVYRLREGSSEVKAKVGDFNLAVSPEDQPGLLDQSLSRILDGTPLAGITDFGRNPRMEEVLGVSVVCLDRDERLIALRPNDYWPNRLGVPDLLNQLTATAALDLSGECILDPVARDFFTRKLKATLRAIKNPPSAVAVATADLALALGDERPRGPRRTAACPAEGLLWEPQRLAATSVSRDVSGLRAKLEGHGHDLNASQWDAFASALTHRLQTIWGPPGTGKSKTLRAIALGACADAHDNGRPLRLLVGASTYTAIDNVLDDIARDLPALLGPGADVKSFRLRSSQRDHQTAAMDAEITREDHGPNQVDLQQRLTAQTGVTVVGSTPEQLNNLLEHSMGAPMFEAFDFLILDEASQTDVAHATLFAAAMAQDATVVAAGDTRQLAPITQAHAPAHLEALVGSLLNMLEVTQAVVPMALDTNYRSNQAIVDLAHVAGYEPSLVACSPDLQLDLEPAPAGAPAGWPAALTYDPGYEALLDSGQPVAAFVYDDEQWSSQWNDFEAQTVAGVVAALRARMQADLLNDRSQPAGGVRRPISDDEFWTRGIGIVTPHRAQQALVLRDLIRAFPAGSAELLRGAVDTVERFQGQQRDVIIVSYALGDPDAIAQEDEFLMGFNRFNVASSRARAKLIVLVSQQVISHLSDDVDVLADSKLLKQFATTFCSASAPLTLPLRGATATAVAGRRLWRP